MLHGLDHAPYLGLVLVNHGVADAPDAKSTQGPPLPRPSIQRRTHLRHLELDHLCPSVLRTENTVRTESVTAPQIESQFRPRRSRSQGARSAAYLEGT